MNKRGSILIVDNLVDMVEALRDWLARQGYQVWVAKERLEALEIAKIECIHLLIVDLRLNDENDPEDTSGIDLARELDNYVLRKILLTGHGDTHMDLITEATNRDENGHRLIDQVHYKRGSESVEELYLAIKTLFIDMGYNTDLEISRETGFRQNDPVESMKDYSEKTDTEKKQAVEKVDFLIRRSFDKATKVKLLKMEQGRGGNALIRAQPILDTGPGNEVVLKVGPKASIRREYENYREFVRDYLGDGRSTQINAAVYYQDLGMIKNTFLAGTIENFKSYYERNKPNTIINVLRDLFMVTCGKWYQGVRHPRDEEIKPLDTWYRRQLGFDEERRVTSTRNRVKDVVDGNGDLFDCFEFSGQDGLLLRLEGQEHCLPNPVHYALEAWNSDLHPGFFAAPRWIAVTHGDLNPSNVIIDQQHGARLIDFFHTGRGPVLRDAQEMESAIKFELLGPDLPLDCFRLEQELFSKTSLDQPLRPIKNASPQMRKALQIIEFLRSWAHNQVNGEDIDEYYSGLLYYAVRQLTLSMSGKDHEAVSHRRQHALISAALACQAIMKCR